MTPYGQPAPAAAAPTDPLSQLLAYLKPQAAPITPGAGQPPAMNADGTPAQPGAQPGGKTPGSLSNLGGDIDGLTKLGTSIGSGVSSLASGASSGLSSILGLLFP